MLFLYVSGLVVSFLIGVVLACIILNGEYDDE